LLLGVLAALFEFLPILDTLASGATCVLLALATRGWVIALLVLGYFVVVHLLEGYILGPRIIGRALGLHSVVAILALVAGTKLFGLWGAIFAAPLAGVLLAVLLGLWKAWHRTHPETFLPPEAEDEETPAFTAAFDETPAPAPEGQEAQEAGSENDGKERAALEAARMESAHFISATRSRSPCILRYFP
jgi:AI-2E family transporter